LGLQHCYARLTEENPDFNLHLKFMNSHDITRAVIQNSIDFGIVTNPAPYPDLLIKKLRKDHVAIYGVKGKNLKKIIYYNPNMNQCAKILQKFKDHKHIRIEDYEVLAQLSMHSQSLALLPGPVAARYPRLQQRGDKLALVDIALIYRADRPKTYTFKFVVDELLQAYTVN
jgi:DNA-binding transcriptional LysR family regulator